MPATPFDLIVIGTGPGGEGAAMQAVKQMAGRGHASARHGMGRDIAAAPRMGTYMTFRQF